MKWYFVRRIPSFEAAPIVIMAVCFCCSFAAASYVNGAVSQKVKKAKTIEKKVIREDIVMAASMPEESIAGSTVELTISMENQSREDVKFYWTGEVEFYALKVSDGIGRKVPLTNFGKDRYAEGRKFGPGVLLTLVVGRRKENTINLARVFDLTQKGDYTLSVGLGDGNGLKIEKMMFKILEPR